MSETLALAVVTGATGLGGALIGAFVVQRVEQRRDARRGKALRARVQSDLYAWHSVVLHAANRQAIVASIEAKLKWDDVSGEFWLHIPNGLYYMVEYLYFTRDKAEVALKLLRKGADDAVVFEGAQAELRTWALTFQEVLGLWRQYDERAWHHRLFRRRRRLEDGSDESRESLEKEIRAKVVVLLRDRYGHDVDDEGSLLAMKERYDKDGRGTPLP